MKKIVIVGVVCLFCLCSLGVEYYVDDNSRGGPADDAGPGIKEKPWRTLARAFRPDNPAVSVGDIVWVREGTYKEMASCGSWGWLGTNGILIKAYGDEKVIIDGESKRSYGIILNDCNNVRIEGLEFRNFASGGACISLNNCTGIKVRKIKASGAFYGVIIYNGSSQCSVLESELFENFYNVMIGARAEFILLAGNYLHHSRDFCVYLYADADRCIGQGEVVSVKPHSPGLAILTTATLNLEKIRSFGSPPLGQDDKGTVKIVDSLLLFAGTNNPTVLSFSKLSQEIQGGGARQKDGRFGFVLRNNPEWGNQPFSPDGKSALFEVGSARPEALAEAGYVFIIRNFDPANFPRDIQIISNEVAYSGSQGVEAPTANRVLFKGNNVHHSFCTGLQVETTARNYWIEGNRFWANSTGGSETGCWLDEMQEGVVQDNIIYENQRGIYFSQSEWVVVRRNIIVRNQSQFVTDVNHSQKVSRANSGAFGFSGGRFYHMGSYPGMRHLAFVHNTCYGNGHATSTWSDILYGVGGTPVVSSNNPVLNNIFQHGVGAATVHISGILPEVMDGNIYYRTDSVKFFFKGQIRDFADFQKETGLDAHSLVAEVAFVDPARDDFRLAKESVAIDKGRPLTTALGTGTGNKLAVADTCFFAAGFKDGHGVLIIPGDDIMVAGVKAHIMDIDRRNGILVLDHPLAWKKGDAVTYVYHGTAPDAGAIESE